jgi:hypothetical protein
MILQNYSWPFFQAIHYQALVISWYFM